MEQLAIPAWVLILVIVWALPWKAMALWRAARNESLVWFIVLFLINTVGILDILYLFVFGKKKSNGQQYNNFSPTNGKSIEIRKPPAMPMIQ